MRKIEWRPSFEWVGWTDKRERMESDVLCELRSFVLAQHHTRTNRLRRDGTRRATNNKLVTVQVRTTMTERQRHPKSPFFAQQSRSQSTDYGATYPLASFVARHVAVVLCFEGASQQDLDSAVLRRTDHRVLLTFVLYMFGHDSSYRLYTLDRFN